jgi:hypothetical protein
MLPENFYLAGLVAITLTSLISLTFSLIIIFAVVVNRRCHSVSNLLVCHTSSIVFLYALLFFWMSAEGFKGESPLNQSACVFRGYAFAVLSAATSYSYTAHALSRLFFVIFSKHRFLLKYHVHFGLIVGTWLVSILIPIEPLFYNGYQYEKESRLCIVTTKQFCTSFYIIIMVFMFPVNVIIVIYGIILKHIRNSAHRINPIPQQNANVNIKREVKVFLNIIIQVGILSFGGTPFFILVVWHSQQEPPEWFYSISSFCISLGFSIMMLVCFLMNKTIQETLPVRFRRHRRQTGGNALQNLHH